MEEELTEEQKIYLRELVETSNFISASEELLSCPLCGMDMRVVDNKGNASKSLCENGHMFAMNIMWLNN